MIESPYPRTTTETGREVPAPSMKHSESGLGRRSRIPVNESFRDHLSGWGYQLGSEDEPRAEAVIINEAQLLLAEKRTSLAVMRTGISVFVLPLSVLSVLVATSRYYDISRVMQLVVPLLGLCAGLVVLGVYLTHRSIIKIRRYERALKDLKKEHAALARFID